MMKLLQIGTERAIVQNFDGTILMIENSYLMELDEKGLII